MTNKFNLDLRFLYQKPLNRDYMVGGGTDWELVEWRSKYENGENAFNTFVKECSLDDLVYLLIFTFKKTFPNIGRFVYTLSSESIREIENKRKYYDFYRRDIISFDTDLYFGPILDEFLPEDRDVYETTVRLKFSNTFDIAAVEEALNNVNYTSENSGELTTYLIQDSPIEKLEVTLNSFSIYINQNKVISYYKM